MNKIFLSTTILTIVLVVSIYYVYQSVVIEDETSIDNAVIFSEKEGTNSSKKIKHEDVHGKLMGNISKSITDNDNPKKYVNPVKQTLNTQSNMLLNIGKKIDVNTYIKNMNLDSSSVPRNIGPIVSVDEYADFISKQESQPINIGNPVSVSDNHIVRNE